MTCGRGEAAEPPAPFSEEAVQRGIDFFTPLAPGAGRGLGFIDLDADGDPDLVALGGRNALVGVYENTGTGHFVSRSASSGIALLPGAAGVSIIDFDLNGTLDLHIARWGMPNRLLQNHGDFTFSDVTAAAGVGDAGNGAGCPVADFDLDGWPDIYVANITTIQSPPTNRLYRNLGNGAFQEVAAQLGVNFDALTWQAIFFDYDRDGDADLYISNDKGQNTCLWNNYLYANAGGTFVDVTAQSGTGVCIDSMGVAVGDFDGNGWQDLYCTNFPQGNPLLLNQGNGTFVNAMNASGVGSFAIGWGAVFFDFDNDARLDLYVCNQNAPNRLYHNTVWPCADIASGMGVNLAGSSYCVAVADIDNDGDLDLIVQNDNDRLRLFINHEGERRRWVKLKVRGKGADVFGIGTNVEVLTGPTRQLREVQSSTNFKSQNELTLHFGLNDAVWIDQVLTTWPGGSSRAIGPLYANTTWTLYPPEWLGHSDDDAVCGLGDFLHFYDCFNAPGMLNLTPGCEMMDFNGDARIEEQDYANFIQVYTGPLDDCNANGQVDITEILYGLVPDQTGNGVPDQCDADLTHNGVVNVDDLLLLIANWGCQAPPIDQCAGDANGDGAVNVNDLLMVITYWG